MRRMIVFAMTWVLWGLPTALRADSWYSPQPPMHVYYMPHGKCPYGYTTFGQRLRGGYGRNGFAPICGPVWGPQAFMPAAGRGVDIRPNGSYIRSLGMSEAMFDPNLGTEPQPNPIATPEKK